jgi:hypothetical protein
MAENTAKIDIEQMTDHGPAFGRRGDLRRGRLFVSFFMAASIGEKEFQFF